MFQLQNSISDTTQQIKDLFALASLNLTALDLVSNPSGNKLRDSIQKVLDNFQSIQSLRLQQFIKHQIYLEGDLERVDRMRDYEEKIQMQRRLISDKETNFLGLFKRKSLMSLSASAEDYAQVQMNKRRVEKENSTEYYKNDLVTLNHLKTKFQQDRLQKQQYLFRIKQECAELNKMRQVFDSVVDDPCEYMAFKGETVMESSVGCQESDRGIQDWVKKNGLMDGYLKRLRILMKGNEEIRNKLKVKASLTKTLQSQNQSYKMVLGKKSKPDLSTEEKESSCLEIFRLPGRKDRQ